MVIKIDIDQIVEKEESNFSGRIQYGQNRARPRYEQNYRNDCRRGKFRGNMRTHHNFGRQNSRIVEEDIEEVIEMKIIIEKEVGVGLEKDHFQGIIIEETTEA